jgi:hypothetical protein
VQLFCHFGSRYRPLGLKQYLQQVALSGRQDSHHFFNAGKLGDIHFLLIHPRLSLYDEKSTCCHSIGIVF